MIRLIHISLKSATAAAVTRAESLPAGECSFSGAVLAKLSSLSIAAFDDDGDVTKREKVL